MTYTKLATFITEPGKYRIHYVSLQPEEYQLYNNEDEFATIPCIGTGSETIHTPFPFFKLSGITKVEKLS